MSSSRVQTTFTGFLMALEICTASWTKWLSGTARRPNPPPQSIVFNFTCSGLRPVSFDGVAVGRLKLRAGPDLGAVGAHVGHAIHRLHRSVRKIRQIVNRL